MRGCRKARLWLKLQGKFPGVQYATRSYRWIGADGRPASPPPERLQSGVTDSGSLRGNNKIRLDPDERKVCVIKHRVLSCYQCLRNDQVSIMVSEGKELGVSIRGGAEHGLGIYISKVDNGSVADDYGLKVWYGHNHLNVTDMISQFLADTVKMFNVSVVKAKKKAHCLHAYYKITI